MISSVAIIGLGAAARTIHIPAIKKLGRLRIVGGYDTSGVAKDTRFPVFSSVAEMLERVSPEMVVIATPPSSHFELARQCLASGCHVFCEKPLAENVSDARKLAELAAEAGRHVFINSEFPWMPIHSAAKRAMSEPGFGRLQFISMHQTFVVNAETERGWRGEELQRTFKEFGTHTLDLASYFYNEAPRAVRARMPKPAGPGSPDLLNMVELEFSGDRYALIVLDRLSKGRHRYLDIRLDGETASIETSIGGQMRVSLGLNAKTRRPFFDLDISMGGRARLFHGEQSRTLATAPLDLFADATARLLGDALDAIQKGKPPPNALPQATRTLELLLASYASAADGLRRELPG